jgi:hypothetical protein
VKKFHEEIRQAWSEMMGIVDTMPTIMILIFGFLGFMSSGILTLYALLVIEAGWASTDAGLVVLSVLAPRAIEPLIVTAVCLAIAIAIARRTIARRPDYWKRKKNKPSP